MTTRDPTQTSDKISCLPRVLLTVLLGAAAPWILFYTLPGSGGFAGIAAALYTLPALIVAPIGGLLGEVIGRQIHPSQHAAYLGLCLGSVLAGMSPPLVMVFIVPITW